ncbi:MAG: hypothetical protein HC769_20720 [Cyanobacteria bacterium CRU_2_1]|nr:hypothetical protein [Cyanobacteria bacterium CRU_2_1]
MPPFQPRFTQSSQQETVKHTLRPIDEPQMHPKPIAPLVSGGALGRSPLKVFLAVMLTMIFLALTASISVKSYVAMRSHMQQEHQQILLLAEQLRDQEDFQSCVEVLSNISFISPVYQQSQILRNTCLTSLDEALFNKAQTSAAEGRFKEAIQLAKKISSSQYIDSAQTFIHDCSTRICRLQSNII